MAFSGVLHTEGVGSFGNKVCFDYVWKPGDSKGLDRAWDCSQLSQPEIDDCFATLAPGCCPILRSTYSWWQETLVWASTVAGMQFLSDGLCPHTFNSCHTGRFLTMQLVLLMMAWLTQLPTLEKDLCVRETPSVFMLCCMKSGTKREIEHVSGKCSESPRILCHCCYTLSDYLLLPLKFESRAEPVSWLSMQPSSSTWEMHILCLVNAKCAALL